MDARQEDPRIVELDEVEDIRTVWKAEAKEFTPWLAQHGLAKLGDELGMPSLELDDTETKAGRYRADILAHVSVADGEKEYVIIENQLEQTNHDHLGKAIVYAAQRNARHIVWVVPKTTDEHRDTIAWLNRHTTAELRFYLVQISLSRLAERRFAFKFNVVERPDEDDKEQTENPRDRRLREFWTGFREFAGADRELAPIVPPRKCLPQNWYCIHIGTGCCKYALVVANGRFAVDLLATNRRGVELLSRAGERLKCLVPDSEFQPMNAALKTPKMRFTNAALADDGPKSAGRAYEWYKGVLLRLTPELKRMFAVP